MAGKQTEKNPLVIVNNILVDGTTCEGDVKIPEGVTRIEGYSFHRCDNLTSIEIPNSVTRIGVETFSGCESLTNIEIPDSVTSIGEHLTFDADMSVWWRGTTYDDDESFLEAFKLEYPDDVNGAENDYDSDH